MRKILKYFLIFVPLSIVVAYTWEDSIWTFSTSAAAIIPLAMYMNKYIDRLATALGSALGGLLSVTFGNATELIISLFAIRDGLLSVVKAAITGSIVMNLLLVLGLSFFLGGLKHRRQSFDKLVAVTNSAMLMLAVAGMLLPAIFYFGSPKIETLVLGRLSLGVAGVLFLTYLASLYFTLVVHQEEKDSFAQEEEPEGREKKTDRKKMLAEIGILLLITSLIAVEANFLVSSLQVISDRMHISPVFIGIVIIPIISNVAENYTAISMARKNKINLSINIAIGSSIQVALLLVPLLIFISHLIGSPMNVLFNILEISSIAMSVLAINVVYLQGKSNWFEGVQLIAVYLIIAIAFYFA